MLETLVQFILLSSNAKATVSEALSKYEAKDTAVFPGIRNTLQRWKPL